MKEGDVGDNDLTARLVEPATRRIWRAMRTAAKFGYRTIGSHPGEWEALLNEHAELLSRLQAAEKVVEAAEGFAGAHSAQRDHEEIHDPCISGCERGDLLADQLVSSQHELREALAAWKEQG